MAIKQPPRYDVRNDGIGPYAIFYCDKCTREYRSQPDVQATITQDVGRNVMGGFLRGIPLVGRAAADAALGQDPRYTYSLTPAQVQSAWGQVSERFEACPTCQQTVCVSCWDAKAGVCKEDSPRSTEIAEAEGAQAAATLQGVASVFGLGAHFRQISQAAKQAQTQAQAAMAKCPNDGTMAEAGTKFCPECGTQMVQPVAVKCPSCGADPKGGKFCPECGTAIAKPEANTQCPNCGFDAKGAKFCPECGTKVV